MEKTFFKKSISIYGRLLTYVWPHKYKFLCGILGSVFYSAIDAYFTSLMKPILDKGFIYKDPHFIQMLPFLIVGIFLIRGIANFIGNYCMAAVGRDVVLALRNKMFTHLTRSKTEFFDHSSSGQLLSKIIYNADQVAEASTDAITTVVQSIVLIVGLLVVMFVINWRLTLIYLFAIPMIGFIVKLSSKHMRRMSSKVQNSLGEVADISEQFIEGYREIRMLSGEKYIIEKFKSLTLKNRYHAMKRIVSKNLSSSAAQVIGAFVLAVSILLATTNSLVMAHLTPGSFIALLTAMIMILKPLKDFTNVNNTIQQGLAGAASVFELLDTPLERDTGKKTVSTVKGKIEFRDVSFAYKTSDGPVLRDLNIVIEPGEMIALVGRSGGGKSTLVSLIPRFYDVTSGSILIDDIAVEEIALSNLRSHIALVSQQVVLFNDTIAHNVAYGCLEKYSLDMIWDALDRAHAREFVEKLPMGIDSIVGENGVLLSGGQRQRLAIARAILKNTPILILDEATSALDSHAERYIQAAIDDLVKNRTTLVIAHRLSTIQNANRIIVMEHGRMVEMGKHEELLAKGAYYAELYRSQFQHEKIKV
jgi:subfamily B ATP-binding cassette protein MsbA